MKHALVAIVAVLVGAVLGSWFSGARGYSLGYKTGVDSAMLTADVLKAAINLQRSCIEKVKTDGPAESTIKDADLLLSRGAQMDAIAEVTGDLVGHTAACDQGAGFNALTMKDFKRWWKPMIGNPPGVGP